MDRSESHLEKDPVCGMDVEPESAAGSYEHAGRVYYFCCDHCLERFKADPAQFLTDAAVPQAQAEPVGKGGTYTCPMDPEVNQSVPGACPKCGMALEPLLGASPFGAVEYVCPMHPEIVRAEPGACPICGMALEARAAVIEEGPNPELVDMTRRFWASVALAVPVAFLAMCAPGRGTVTVSSNLRPTSRNRTPPPSLRNCSRSGRSATVSSLRRARRACG